MSRKSFNSPESGRKEFRSPETKERGFKKLLGALSRRKRSVVFCISRHVHANDFSVAQVSKMSLLPPLLIPNSEPLRFLLCHGR